VLPASLTMNPSTNHELLPHTTEGDSLFITILMALLPYFIRYIVEPEYSSDECMCESGTISPDAPWSCSSEKVLGACLGALIICAFVFSPYGARF
jgi:hypothetical protein